MHELQRVLEWQVWKFAGGVLSQPQSSALDRSAEADVRVRLDGQERMFSPLTKLAAKCAFRS